MKRYILLILCFSLAFSACKKEKFDPVKQAATDRYLIEQFIEGNHITATRDTSGLYYFVYEPGTGAQPTIDDKVTVTYDGKLISGVTFDSQTEVEYPLKDVIRGWQIGLQHIRTGGKILLLIPSDLAYGNRQIGVVPKNSVLVFTITLNAVN